MMHLVVDEFVAEIPTEVHLHLYTTGNGNRQLHKHYSTQFLSVVIIFPVN